MIFQSQPPTNPIIDKPISIIQKAEEPEKPEPKLYTVAPGDSLTKIAESQGTTVDRLWDANVSLTNPDVLDVNQQLKIPLSDEQLADRPMPVQNTPTAPQNSSQSINPTPARPTVRASSSGNTYTVGYCTHYAKQMRPDLPNRMGNAINWASAARSAGFSVGSIPRVGAIAQLGNHVSYVVSVGSKMGNKRAWEEASRRHGIPNPWSQR